MKYALITGASSGIGAATAKLFSEHQYGVVLVGRNHARLESVAKTLPSPFKVVQADLSRATERDRVVQVVLEDNAVRDNLKVLVNNAGIFSRSDIEELKMQDFHEQMEVNFFAPVQLMKGLLSTLEKNGPSSVINVSSTLGIRPVPATAHYSATKSALINFSQTAALEWAPKKIRVNVVAPGLVETPIHGLDQMPPEARQKALQNMNALQPMGRVGRPAEVAQAIYFLADETFSPWTTGSVLSVDGGIGLV